MRKIDIQITKARLESFSVSFNENETMPEISATLALMTEGEKKISTYSISTSSWNNNKFEMPVGVIQPILDIAREIEIVVTKHCRESQLALN